MRQRMVHLGLVCLVGVFAYGLYLSGSPSHVRKVTQDFETLREMNRIHCALSRQHHETDALPLRLEAGTLGKHLGGSSAGCNFYCDYERLEEAQLKRYSYEPAGDRYKICAAFLSDWQSLRQEQGLEKESGRSYHMNDIDWAKDYASGQHCFTRTLLPCNKKEK